MKLQFNEKLTFFLLLALAFNVSSLWQAKKSYARDFASTDIVASSDIEDCIQNAKQNGEATCSVDQNDKHFDGNSITRSASLHIKVNKENVNGKEVSQIEGRWSVDDACDCGATSKGGSSFFEKAGNLGQIVKVASEKLKIAKMKAEERLRKGIDTKAKEDRIAKEKKRCDRDSDGAISDSQTDRKMACFRRQIENLDSKKARKRYEEDYVQPYFSKKIEPVIAQQISSGDPRMAQILIGQLSGMGLGNAISGKLTLMNEFATIKDSSLQYRMANAATFEKWMPTMSSLAAQLSSPNPMIRAQASAQYNQAVAAYNQEMNNNSTIHFNQLLSSENTMQHLNMQAALGGSLMGDPAMSSLISTTNNQLNQNIQSMISSNKALSSTIGNRFAQTFGLGNSLSGAASPITGKGLAGGSLIANDPIAAELGLTKLSAGPAGPTDTWNQAWNPTANGTNAATHVTPVAPITAATLRTTTASRVAVPAKALATTAPSGMVNPTLRYIAPNTNTTVAQRSLVTPKFRRK